MHQKRTIINIEGLDETVKHSVCQHLESVLPNMFKIETKICEYDKELLLPLGPLIESEAINQSIDMHARVALRNQLCHTEIVPAMHNGRVAICKDHLAEIVAIFSFGFDFPKDMVMKESAYARGAFPKEVSSEPMSSGLMPAVTVFLDSDPKDMADLSSSHHDYLKKIRQGYLEIGKHYSDWYNIGTNQSQDNMKHAAALAVAEVLARHFN